MKIAIPEEFKDTYWDRKLYLSRISKNSFVLFTQEDRDKIEQMLDKMGGDPDRIAFNRFMLSGLVETKSVSDLLELSELFEDFSKGEVSFSLEKNTLTVSKA